MRKPATKLFLSKLLLKKDVTLRNSQITYALDLVKQAISHPGIMQTKKKQVLRAIRAHHQTTTSRK